MVGEDTYAQNPPRVILVICDTTIGHSSLSHDGIETGIGDGSTDTVPSSYEGVDGSISAVFLFNLGVPLPTHIEERPTHSPNHGKNAHDSTSRDSSHVDTRPGLFLVVVLFICRVCFSER